METRKRGNYDSGDDFVLEYGELRFTFNERDFSERCEQAAMKLGFVGGRLGETELEDLVNLAVNGEIPDPARSSASTSTTAGPSSSGPRTARSSTGCGAWSSARRGWTSGSRRASSTSPSTPHSQSFAYVQPDRGNEPIELAPEPSWGRVAYVPR